MSVCPLDLSVFFYSTDASQLQALGNTMFIQLPPHIAYMVKDGGKESQHTNCNDHRPSKFSERVCLLVCFFFFKAKSNAKCSLAKWHHYQQYLYYLRQIQKNCYFILPFPVSECDWGSRHIVR